MECISIHGNGEGEELKKLIVPYVCVYFDYC
jgi:hypothetical protein